MVGYYLFMGFEANDPTLPLQLEFTDPTPTSDYLVAMTDYSARWGYTFLSS